MRVGRSLAPLVGGGALGAGGAVVWRVADRLLETPAEVAVGDAAARDRVSLLALGEGWIELAGPDADRPGRWGLRGASGYGQVGSVNGPARSGTGVRRPFRPVRGELAAGTEAVWNQAFWPDDPGVLGLTVEEASYRSTAGELPAWRFPAPGRIWAVFVHGRGGRRNEAFRLVPLFVRAGVPALVIAYRNDAEAPARGDGRCHLGASEWEDVEGAVVHALASGAEGVVLVGYSMGGAAVLSFLRRSAHATRVGGVLLDAPVVDWVPVVRRGAINAGVAPALATLLAPAALEVARRRAGIDRELLDHHGAADVLPAPTLLIHGAADERVPVAASDALAARRRDAVTYLRVPEAGHVRSWNVAPGAVEDAVDAWLEQACSARGGARRLGGRSLLRRGRRRRR